MNKTINKFTTGIALVAVLTCGYAIGSHDQSIRDQGEINRQAGVSAGAAYAREVSEISDLSMTESSNKQYREGFRAGFIEQAQAIAYAAAAERMCFAPSSKYSPFQPFVTTGREFAVPTMTRLARSIPQQGACEGDPSPSLIMAKTLAGRYQTVEEVAHQVKTSDEQVLSKTMTDGGSDVLALIVKREATTYLNDRLEKEK